MLKYGGTTGKKTAPIAEHGQDTDRKSTSRDAAKTLQQTPIDERTGRELDYQVRTANTQTSLGGHQSSVLEQAVDWFAASRMHDTRTREAAELATMQAEQRA